MLLRVILPVDLRESHSRECSLVRGRLEGELAVRGGGGGGGGRGRRRLARVKETCRVIMEEWGDLGSNGNGSSNESSSSSSSSSSADDFLVPWSSAEMKLSHVTLEQKSVPEDVLTSILHRGGNDSFSLEADTWVDEARALDQMLRMGFSLGDLFGDSGVAALSSLLREEARRTAVTLMVKGKKRSFLRLPPMGPLPALYRRGAGVLFYLPLAQSGAPGAELYSRLGKEDDRRCAEEAEYVAVSPLSCAAAGSGAVEASCVRGAGGGLLCARDLEFLEAGGLACRVSSRRDAQIAFDVACQP